MNPARPLLLLVDDTPEIAQIVVRLGARAGHEVASCWDVASAWEYLGQTRPDLLILDVNLPGENGLVLCRRLRATPRLGDVSVALFSHPDRQADIAAGLEAGVDFVTSKDLLCRPEDWQARVREVLTPVDSRPRFHSLSWSMAPDTARLDRDRVEAVNRVLRSLLPGLFGPEVLLVLLRRAATEAGPDFRMVGLAADGLGLNVEQVARAYRFDAIVRFAAALAEQTWRVLGTTASTPLWAALARAVSSSPDVSLPS
jgi:DNA-binding response OmpR family regulator